LKIVASWSCSVVVSVSIRRALGRPPVEGVDQHGFLDAGQGVEQFARAHGQSGLGGVAAHQVGDLQGQHAGEGVPAESIVHGVGILLPR
jgi:hypothetical protein